MRYMKNWELCCMQLTSWHDISILYIITINNKIINMILKWRVIFQYDNSGTNVNGLLNVDHFKIQRKNNCTLSTAYGMEIVPFYFVSMGNQKSCLSFLNLLKYHEFKICNWIVLLDYRIIVGWTYFRFWCGGKAKNETMRVTYTNVRLLRQIERSSKHIKSNIAVVTPSFSFVQIK